MARLNILCVAAAVCCLAKVTSERFPRVQESSANLGVRNIDRTWDNNISSVNEREKINFSQSDVSDNHHAMRSRMLGGFAAAKGQYPFVLCVRAFTPLAGIRLCTGALVTNLYALVSVSCVHDASSVEVIANTLDCDASNPIYVRQGNVKFHPNILKTPKRDYDVAIIKLNSPFSLSVEVDIINIAYNAIGINNLANKGMKVIGFGGNNVDNPTIQLTSLVMRVLSKGRCTAEMKKYNVRVTPDQECLNTERGRLGVCHAGDRGALITYRFQGNSQYTLLGIMSYYYICGVNTPNLFTRIAPFKAFIQEYITMYENLG